MCVGGGFYKASHVCSSVYSGGTDNSINTDEPLLDIPWIDSNNSSRTGVGNVILALCVYIYIYQFLAIPFICTYVVQVATLFMCTLTYLSTLYRGRQKFEKAKV